VVNVKKTDKETGKMRQEADLRDGVCKTKWAICNNLYF